MVKAPEVGGERVCEEAGVAVFKTGAEDGFEAVEVAVFEVGGEGDSVGVGLDVGEAGVCVAAVCSDEEVDVGKGKGVGSELQPTSTISKPVRNHRDFIIRPLANVKICPPRTGLRPAALTRIVPPGVREGSKKSYFLPLSSGGLGRSLAVLQAVYSSVGDREELGIAKASW
jgi:hypothetical protein